MFSFNGIAVPNRSNMLTHEELRKVINQIHFNDRAQVCETCHEWIPLNGEFSQTEKLEYILSTIPRMGMMRNKDLARIVTDPRVRDKAPKKHPYNKNAVAHRFMEKYGLRVAPMIEFWRKHKHTVCTENDEWVLISFLYDLDSVIGIDFDAIENDERSVEEKDADLIDLLSDFFKIRLMQDF